jgi:hypothetical protein
LDAARADVARAAELDARGKWRLPRAAALAGLAHVDRAGAAADRAGAGAVALLRQAAAAGAVDGGRLQADPDFAPLRRRADYAELLWDLVDTPAAGPANTP